MNYRQKNWPEQLLLVEFMVNNKVYSVIKVSPFIVKYNRELRIGANIRRKEKIEKIIEFTEKIKKIQKEIRAVLKKIQKEIKRQIDRKRKEVEEQKRDNKMILSTKDLMFKEQLVKKVVD